MNSAEPPHQLMRGLFYNDISFCEQVRAVWLGLPHLLQLRDLRSFFAAPVTRVASSVSISSRRSQSSRSFWVSNGYLLSRADKMVSGSWPALCHGSSRIERMGWGAT